MTEKEFLSEYQDDEEVTQCYLSQPTPVRAAMRACPPRECYRGKGGMGHYSINCYGETLGGKIIVEAIHGQDSFAPGYGVFGMPLDDLRLCGCGHWKPWADA